MTPAQVYGLKPIIVLTELGRITRFLHEVGCDVPESVPGVEIKVHCDPYIDGYRSYYLASVWFHGNPIMIVQLAGRSDDDHEARFITNQVMFIEMIKAIRRQAETDWSYSMDDTIGFHDERQDLVDFYGNTYESVMAHDKELERKRALWDLPNTLNSNEPSQEIIEGPQG